MNINDVPAGPKMDRLIAELAMGWRWTFDVHEAIDDALELAGTYSESASEDEYRRSAKYPCFEHDSSLGRDPEILVLRSAEDEGRAKADMERWSPSTNIAQAWEVYDHLTGKLEWGGTIRTDTMYRIHAVELYRPIPERRSVAAADKSLPLAICRAALLAMGWPER